MNLNWVIETHDTVQSTQDIAMKMADSGKSEGYIIQARIQTKGRGRHGRVWQSEGGNLFLSIIFRPECDAQNIGQLSLIGGLSLAQVIGEYIDKQRAGVSLKWPNDVLLNGQKCAGLLLETDLKAAGNVNYAVLGLGVNIAAAPQEFGSALNVYTDAPVQIDAFRDQFLKNMEQNYKDWLSHGFDGLRENWLLLAHVKGQEMTVKIGSQLEKGFFHDIDAKGNLRLEDEKGRLKLITSGEVYCD